MRFRRKRCLLISSLSVITYLFWRWSGPTNDGLDDKAALSLLHPNHLAEDSKKGILYHHNSHKGFENYHIANDTWVRNILFPFDTERLAASFDDVGIAWRITDEWIQQRTLHPPFDASIVKILKKMTTASIVRADVYPKGTQLKLLLTLDGGQEVVFKPKWYDNDFILFGTPYVGKDRHYAEIAGFHLNRLLQFDRIPPIIGRRINVLKELLPVMTKRLNQTIYSKELTSGLRQTCFYGKCYYCRGPSTGVCSDNAGFLDGALILHLPKTIRLKRHPHPWRRTYIEDVKAPWETDGRGYCDNVLRRNPSWISNGHLLDLIDASVYDFLISNADRHHYETLANQENAVVLLMDSGKGFGNPYVDEISILAPMTHCCKIRQSTWKRLDQLSNGSLSESMRRLLLHDPLSPLLSQLNLNALDRRIRTIVALIHRCISRKGYRNVLINDQRT